MRGTICIIGNIGMMDRYMARLSLLLHTTRDCRMGAGREEEEIIQRVAEGRRWKEEQEEREERTLFSVASRGAQHARTIARSLARSLTRTRAHALSFSVSLSLAPPLHFPTRNKCTLT